MWGDLRSNPSEYLSSLPAGARLVRDTNKNERPQEFHLNTLPLHTEELTQTELKLSFLFPLTFFSF